MSRIACALGAAGLAGSVLGFVLVGEGPDAPHAASAVRPVEQATRVAPAPELAAPQGWMEARSLAAVTPASAPSAAALGRAPATTTVAEGAAEMGRYLATPELRGAEAIALGRAVAQDPEMAALLTGQAAAWRGSPEPSLRARGLLLEASLGRLDALGWQQAVAAEADLAARALMVANPRPARPPPRTPA